LDLPPLEVNVPRPILRSLVLTAVSFLILAGCSDSGDGDNTTGNNSTSGGDIAVTVGSGTTPTYSWAGVGAFTISVTRTSDEGTVVWQIVSMSASDDILSPVTHGTVPTNAVATFTSETALTAGVEYAVSVARTTATETSGYGYAVFTP
jgi:hypothetical protein